MKRWTKSIRKHINNHIDDEQKNKIYKEIHRPIKDVSIASRKIQEHYSNIIEQVREIKEAISIHESFNPEQFYVLDKKSLCIIINQKDFEKDKHPAFQAYAKTLTSREGTDVDCSRLEYTFKLFNFDVVVKKNLTHLNIIQLVNWLSDEQMDNVDDSISSNKLEDYSCLVFCILTHGMEGELYGTNGVAIKIYKDIIYKIASSECKGLMDKAKIFIIQACQGDKDAYARDGADDTLNASIQYSTVPDISDFLIAFPTIPGHSAIRHIHEGSPFIQTLCKYIESHGDKEDIQEVIRLTSDDLAKVDIKNDYGAQLAITAECRTALRKRFRFRRV